MQFSPREPAVNTTRFAACLLAAAIAGSSSLALAEDHAGLNDTPSPQAMALDLVLIRPISLAATVVGVGIFVVNIPFALMRGESPTEPAQRLVVEPARYTFTRRLGTSDER